LNYEEAKTLSLDPSVEALATHVVDAALVVHRELGPGLLESVYHHCLKHELQCRGLSLRSEVEIPVCFKGLQLECGFRVDLIIADRVLIELKSVEGLLPVHKAQLITYLKLTALPVGFLINFNVPLLKNGIHRFIHPTLLGSKP
jgi:GxxExxY protein